jgi:hypothetical protein
MEYTTVIRRSRRGRRRDRQLPRLPVSLQRSGWRLGQDMVVQSTEIFWWAEVDLGSRVLTRWSGGRGDAGGEVRGLRCLESSAIARWSFVRRSVRSSRGCSHRSEDKGEAQLCQEVALGWGGPSGAEMRGRSLLNPTVPSVSSGGAAALICAA